MRVSWGLGVYGFLVLAGCTAGAGGSSTSSGTVRGRSAQAGSKTATVEVGPVRGPDVWVAAEPVWNAYIARGGESRKLQHQGAPAPYKPGEPEPGATHPLTMDGAAQNLLESIKTARPIVEGKLSYDDMKKLEKPAQNILLHASELVRLMERRIVRARIKAELSGSAEEPASEDVSEEGLKAELAASAEWMAVVERVERAAKRLLDGALLCSREGVVKGWTSLLDSARELPQIRAAIDAMAIEKARASSR